MDNFFRNIPLFKDLTPKELAEIQAICRPVVYAPGERLFRMGQPGHDMLIIETGEVWIFRETPLGEKIDINTVKDGEILGEMALVDSEKRSAYATATTEVHAYQIQRKDFIKLRSQMSPAFFKLMRQIAILTCGRVRNLTDKLMREVTGEEAPAEKGGAEEKTPGWLGLWKRIMGS